MAFQLPKINMADAKTRVILIAGGLVGFIGTVYLIVHFIGGGATATGSSKVARAPGGLQSVPGSQLTPEYYRALVQANKQAAKQAQISGGSAVPTLLNEPGNQAGFEQPTTASCTVVCPNEDNVDVQNDLDDLVKAGKLAPEEAKKLSDLAAQNVAVSEYSAALDNMVKSGKLTPDQARKLLDDYKKEHQNKLIAESGKTMDTLIKSGKLPLDAANELLEMQKNQASPEAYAAKLNELVQQGKISPDTASQLLAQYTEQHAREAAKEAKGQIEQMAASGQIAPDVAKELESYQDRHVTPKEYEEELQHLVRQGKLTPEQAKRLAAQYAQVIPPDVASRLADLQRSGATVPQYEAELRGMVAAGKISPEQADALLNQYRAIKGQAPGNTMDDIVHQAERVNEESVRELAQSGRISPETAQQLLNWEQSKVPVDEYKRHLDELVRDGKLQPMDAQRLLVSYMQQRGAGVQDLLDAGKISPETAQKLRNLQQANVPVEEYKKQLDEMVREGKISSEDAQKLLNNYSQLKAAKEDINGVKGLLAEGRISPDTAQKISELQRANVPVDEYKRQLDELVQEGKISPADAQKLLISYMQDKGGGVQDLLRAGKISPDTAQKLMDLQHSNVPVDVYKQQLDQLVKEGKISSEDAQKLLSNYQTMHGAGVQDLLREGKINPETARALMALQQANVPVSEYKRHLDEMVRAGKISPEDAQKLLQNYQQLKGGGTSVQTLMGKGQIPPDLQEKLLGMQKANVPVDEYQRQLNDAVKAGKISQQDADGLLKEYKRLHGVRAEAARLADLRSKNVPLNDYANELKRAVAEGTLTPDQASKLLDEYRDAQTKPVVVPNVATVPSNVKGAEAFNALQQKLQANAAKAPAPAGPSVTKEQFSAAALKSREQAEQAEAQRIQEIMNAMQQQAGQLITSWQAPTMSGMQGAAAKEEAQAKDKKTTATATTAAGGKGGAAGEGATGPIIKAGTILYAVLDTAVNSDFPDTPVLATVVDGKYKGAKLLGKVAVTTGQDKVTLSFKLMDMEDWISGKAVTAFAIDPDTARAALASNVNYHYFVRYGALFASSFLTGYAQAISNSGSTTSSGIFGTTTARPSYSPSQKIMTGLGQVGTTLGNAVSGYSNTPPTVKIDPGVSLGILFMADVSE